MKKTVLVVRIPKDLDEQFRSEVKRQGKQFNLSLEEALKLWLEKNKKQTR
ncbi:MAG: hypothetical protein GX180_09945 [Enterococcus sp.]|nr:hypothetical protein [Enterococcus sp.]